MASASCKRAVTCNLLWPQKREKRKGAWWIHGIVCHVFNYFRLSGAYLWCVLTFSKAEREPFLSTCQQRLAPKRCNVRTCGLNKSNEWSPHFLPGLGSTHSESYLIPSLPGRTLSKILIRFLEEIIPIRQTNDRRLPVELNSGLGKCNKRVRSSGD